MDLGEVFPKEKLEVGVQRLSLVLPKAEQRAEELEQVRRVVQLICQEESLDPSWWAGPSQAEARGAQQVSQENKTASNKYLL